MILFYILTDRSSTEHSLPDDDLQLSDEDCNLMDSMVKYTEQNNYVDNKAQKMMVRVIVCLSF